MPPTDRLFDLIQTLRAARRPLTAAQLAERLETSVRTVYRDIAILQGMRVPIEGEAGVGYVMRLGYDLPPLMFDDDELEALAVGLALVARTGDEALRRSALRAAAKIAQAVPDDRAADMSFDHLRVSTRGAPAPQAFDLGDARAAIRDERKVRLAYLDREGEESVRTILPLALAYFSASTVIAAWCEVCRDFRHFRADRVLVWHLLPDDFKGERARLTKAWLREQKRLDAPVELAWSPDAP